MELGNVCRLGMDKRNCYKCPFVGDFSPKPQKKTFLFCLSLSWCVCVTFPYGGYEDTYTVCTLCKHTRRVTLLQ